MKMRRGLLLAAMIPLVAAAALAAPAARRIGPDLYAYISENDASANSTFLVGRTGILVVDTGLNATEGAKLLAAIRTISSLPVRYVVNTHYHPDHQGGNSTVGPQAVVISTGYTRLRTLQLLPGHPQFMLADVTFQDRLTLYVGEYPVEIYFPGKAHTSGDALVYFPQQQVVATGDLFLNRSSPAMDQGSVANWIKALDAVLARPLQAAVPGHFELGSRADLARFRDYLSDLYSRVSAMYQAGASAQQVRRDIRMEKYADFRQYPQYEATFGDNAEVVFKELAGN